VHPVSGPALVLPLSQGPHASDAQIPSAPPFEHAVALGQAEASDDEAASLELASAWLPSAVVASLIGAEPFASVCAALPSSEATLPSPVVTLAPSALPSAEPTLVALLPPQPTICIADAAPASDAINLHKPSGLLTIRPLLFLLCASVGALSISALPRAERREVRSTSRSTRRGFCARDPPTNAAPETADLFVARVHTALHHALKGQNRTWTGHFVAILAATATHSRRDAPRAHTRRSKRPCCYTRRT
jgi:hypothetical protein